MQNYYASPAFVSTTSRPAFMAKVFALFGLALAFSIGGVYLGIMAVASFPEVFANSLTYYAVFAVELILVFTARAWSRIRGLNYALFLLFTVISGFTAVPILIIAKAVGGTFLLIKALACTVALFGGIALYGYVTHRDLSGMRGFLFISLIGIVIASLINIFVQSSAFDYMLSWVVVVVFSGFTMYDVQMIKHRYPDNMFIEAALALYLDFFNLFLNILNIMMGSSRR